MALNTFKCNYLTTLRFKGLINRHTTNNVESTHAPLIFIATVTTVLLFVTDQLLFALLAFSLQSKLVHYL